MDLCDIRVWLLSWKSVGKIQIWVKIDRNIGHFAGRLKCVHIVGCHICIAIINITHCCVTNILIFIILLTVTCASTTQGGRIVAFPWQQWLRERATVLRYSPLLVLFDHEALSLIYIMATHTVNEKYSMAVFQCICSYQRSGFITGRSSGRGNSLTEYLMRMRL
jgi:hypothetical protein